MATKTSGPTKNTGKSNNSRSYSPGPREAASATTQPSSGGLKKVDSGYNPEEGTNDC